MKIPQRLGLLSAVVSMGLAACSTKPPMQSAAPAPTTAPTVVRLEPTPAPPPPAPRPAEEALPSSVDEINRRGYLADAFFQLDDASIEPSERDRLAKDAAWLRAHPSVAVRIEGHCDERGTEAYNMALGERRAAAVREYLEAAGIRESRLAILSYGKEHPFSAGHEESAWAQNRRSHFVVTALATK